MTDKMRSGDFRFWMIVTAWLIAALCFGLCARADTNDVVKATKLSFSAAPCIVATLADDTEVSQNLRACTEDEKKDVIALRKKGQDGELYKVFVHVGKRYGAAPSETEKVVSVQFYTKDGRLFYTAGKAENIAKFK